MDKPKLNMNILKKVKVENMESTKGRMNAGIVPNQFILSIEGEGRYFQSYDSVIVAIVGGKVYLDKDKWDYSTTTARYRNDFLGEKREEIEAKIKSGEYILTNLN